MQSYRIMASSTLSLPALYSRRQSTFWKQQLLHSTFSIADAKLVHLPQCTYLRPIGHPRGFVKVTAGEANERSDYSKGAEKDVILKCISRTAEVSVISISAKHLVKEAQRRHNASPTALATLGRALMGALLLKAMKSDAESVQITFQGDGPIGKVITIAADEGWVKGFVGNPLCNPPAKESGKLDVGAAVGSGMLSISYFHPSWSQPYMGTVPIFSGEVAEDIAHYLASSEQVNTAIGLGVTAGKDGTLQSAHGFMVQILPFCSEETLTKLEENIRKVPPLSGSPSLISPQQTLNSILDGLGMGEIYTVATPRYGPCDLSELKERMLRAVACLESSDLQQLLQEQGHVEMRCEFCAEVLQFGREELQHLLGKTVS